ncbi:hypothetical protein [Myxococcus landrumensis]|uniref:Uncharacterized protein n=1 Tax=Myxococcus landrumensis TaxID=2813577 RepID=A0ABX7NHM7_9BACT|nr:hypothetical protein [Myxococcus landrumus]QSQ17931.1 hypothetical protein JY572_18685 [Myxococcus landrumus]
MMKAVSKALALLALTASTFASAQDYQDTTPYVVDSAKYPYTLYPSNTQLDDKTPWETQVLPFNPSSTYTPPEQDAVVQGESQMLNAPVYLDMNDGMRHLQYGQKTIPEATTQNVPPPTETVPTQDPSGLRSAGLGAALTGPITKSYQRTELFGNNIFGAGYNVSAAITATPATSTTEKKQEAFTEGRVHGTAFNIPKELVRGRATVCGQQGGCNSGSAALYAMSSMIWSTNLTGNFATTPINWSRSFFSVSKTFMVGPVPLTVKASLTGGVTMRVNGQVNPLLAAVTGTVGGFANVVASAAVNVAIASFGVTGSLQLINASVAPQASLDWGLCMASWQLKAPLNLNALSGTLTGFVKIKLLFFNKTWNVIIANWSGIVRNLVLYNASGTLSASGC